MLGCHDNFYSGLKEPIIGAETGSRWGRYRGLFANFVFVSGKYSFGLARGATWTQSISTTPSRLKMRTFAFLHALTSTLLLLRSVTPFPRFLLSFSILLFYSISLDIVESTVFPDRTYQQVMAWILGNDIMESPRSPVGLFPQKQCSSRSSSTAELFPPTGIQRRPAKFSRRSFRTGAIHFSEIICGRIIFFSISDIWRWILHSRL